ncbi:amidohydrolase family protein [Allokutzneria sp. NRRL B-24872]|uniref:amidohydrolase family protein n=1 Tax=Allokutzneria sp. NRRL B-24872 TaxID=1137961 RepID=UPI000A3C807E|nr:amidohydrolase family protein [Allokutzneria sp. NRRL B-24872]
MSNNISRRKLMAGGVELGVAGALAVYAAPSAGARSPSPARVDSGPRAITAITGATVVDSGRRGVRHNSTVLLRGDRIVEVGPADQVRVPRGATAIDGKGKYVIPGLMDVHVHSVPYDRTFPPLYLINGVTTVREMGGNPLSLEWRDKVAAGTAFGPHSVVASTIVDGKPSLWENIGVPFISVGDPHEARDAVREEKARGVDFIKVYTRLSRASFQAIAHEARRVGIPFLGHCPDFVPVTAASELGLKSLEHLWQIWYATSSQEARLRKAVAQVPIKGGEYGGWYSKMHATEYAAARSIDRRKAEKVFSTFARNGTFVTPTLSVHKVADVPNPDWQKDPNLRYLPTAYAEGWRWQMREIYLQGRTPATDAERRELFQRRRELVPALADAGVPLLAGTDTGTPSLLPGFAMHDELKLLVEAGLSPQRALRAATLEPARYLGREADLGTVEPGKLADLVLLDADPLRDIANTSRIDTVVVRGRVLDRAERGRMLDDVLKAAGEPSAAAPVAMTACPCH